jgi:hypothetical protein
MQWHSATLLAVVIITLISNLVSGTYLPQQHQPTTDAVAEVMGSLG